VISGIVILAATFALVFMRAIQQLNVINHHYKMAAITSYMIAIAEVTSLLSVVAVGWPAVPWVGTGGALGVTAAMATHTKLREYMK
jgi:hypothetical protein